MPVLGQHRSTQRKQSMGRADEAALTAEVVELATQYGRLSYRRITAFLHAAGWAVNVKRVERIWGREWLKAPRRQPKKGRLWLNDGSYVRLRPEHPNHVWSYDFVEDRTRATLLRFMAGRPICLWPGFLATPGVGKKYRSRLTLRLNAALSTGLQVLTA
ncbi:hypothetical protein CHELA1G11_40071 [Hyphomicrobiales bacterium]|nr:hypothetical protein CHELA1G2_40070 [Hyphomicrobiales bacterium]CAH1696471.1 hypothetical protein CHELA1G11_40071 [Hyphomicrobiales bacterium]